MSIYYWTQWELQKRYIRVEAQPVTTAGIYHSPEQWLISLSSDWTNWITIADKNLWATQVYNDGDTLSQTNCGNYYQWWNNYGFPFTWATITSSATVNAWSYWPWNYYSSSTFVTTNPRDNSNNDNLRWWVTWTNEAMKWPCDIWFHIPTKDEWQDIINAWITMWAWTSNWYANFISYLKTPLAWWLINWSPMLSDSYWYYWVSQQYNTQYAYRLDVDVNPKIDVQSYSWKNVWFSIRPFANTPVQPDDSRTVLYTTS